MGMRTFKPTAVVLGALASPLRQDILVVLESAAPISVAELARRIGRRPDTLYPHLRVLERAGLVRSAGSDSTGGRPGSVWRVAANPIRVSAHGTTGANTRHAIRLVGAMSRAGARDFQHAFKRFVAGQGPKPSAKRWCIWLAPAELAALEKSLEELIQRYRAFAPGDGRSPHIVTWLHASVAAPAAQPGAKRPRRAGSHARGSRAARPRVARRAN